VCVSTQEVPFLSNTDALVIGVAGEWFDEYPIEGASQCNGFLSLEDYLGD
jgi:hypothetical protein